METFGKKNVEIEKVKRAVRDVGERGGGAKGANRLAQKVPIKMAEMA